jgi:hypothetical protein
MALIDLDRYPVDQDTETLERAVAQAREQLARDGCAVLKGFLSPAGISALTGEADQAASGAYRSFSRTNAYFTRDNPDLAPRHPARQFFERSNAFIPADNFPASGPLRQVFDHPGFDAFIRRCLYQPEERFFRYADPLADVIVNMAEAGNGFPWHFDTNTFTVTLALQNAETGGDFEYAPMIRRDSENFDEVARVLEGTSDKVRTLRLEPGDLQLFLGRHSLHRVTPLAGSRRRYVAIFSYVEEPDMVGSVERTQQLYGRTLPIHHARAGRRQDALID